MNFFETQDRARRRTKWLVVYFICAVISIVLAVYFGVIFGTTLISGAKLEPWDPGLFLFIAGVTVLLILGGTAYKFAQLRQGGKVVAEGLGGRPVLPSTGDLKERQLLNVVEEMAIASGTPVPLVYVMDEETGINAFAAGTDPSNAVIGVTRGCIELLSRSELQGVIAHEFSHIRNGDMRLNMRLIGFIFGILILMIVGRVLLSSMRYARTSRDSKEGNGILAVVLLVGLVLFLVGAIGGFFARLIQAAVSRQREFLADSSAVQFTRDPGGLTGALKKIGGWGDHSRVKNPQGSAVSHMFFAEGGLFRWGLATHPPLQVRIQALDPAWTQKFDTVSLPAVEMKGRDGSASGAVANLAPSGAAPPASTMNAVETLGHLGDEEGWQLSSGLRVCNEIDQRWRKASQDRRQAQVLIFAMLLSRDLQQRKVQVEGLRKGMGSDYVEALSEWHRSLESLHSTGKIALLDLCIPTLRQLSQPEYERLMQMLDWVVATDEKVDLFEFMLKHALTRHLSGNFAPLSGKAPSGPERMGDLSSAGDVLLSLMAWSGRNSETAAKAFEAAVDGWGPYEGWEPRLLPEDSFDTKMVVAALAEFEVAAPLIKQTILQMCGLAAAEDGVLTSEEAELLRAVADAIGASVPPFVYEERAEESQAELS